MPIEISSNLLPRNGNKFYLLEDTYLRGGLRVTESASERDSIDPDSLKAGMLVVTADDMKLWQLNADLETWREFKTGGGGGEGAPRSSASHTVPEIPSFSYADFSLPLGNGVIVYRLWVDKPCTVEVHSTPDRVDTNPFRFIAKEGYLEDDGSAELQDGTIVRNRRYHIWANLEEEPSGSVFFRILNPEEDVLTVTVNVLYKPFES